MDGNYFYKNEILADFQTRSKATLKDKKSVVSDLPKQIGMPTINPKSNAGKYFVEFASSSTLHGLNHLVTPNRHPLEIFLAVLFIFGALVCLILLSFLFWDRYQNNATVIVVDNNQEQFKIAKPAVFICPVENVARKKLPNVFKKYNIEHTPEAEEFFTFLGSVTYENMTEAPLYDKVPADKWLEILHDLRQNIPGNMLKENDPYESWTVTERGICFATRSIVAVYATLDYWKKNNWTTIPVPDKLPQYNGDGIQENIAVETAALISVCDSSELIVYGTPTKLVKQRIMHQGIMSISEIKTTPNVKELRIQQRKCKFLNDGGLETWPVYTRNMCITECRMKVIQDRCNCRPHFARPINGINTCNAEQLRCIGRIIKHLFLYEYPPSFCNCVPKCNVVSYQIRDTESAEFFDTPLSLSVVNLIVEFPQVIYHRTLLYGFTDFLTSVGGAAGLFLGASVLSFVEIFYYGSLHVCFYIKRNKRKQKKSVTIDRSKM
ncbi:Pickpocket protein 19 [Anthophora retusa]